MASLNEQIRRNIEAMRKEKGWSQEKLSEKAGFSRTFIGMIERGYSQPSISAIEEIADTLDVEPEELVVQSSK